GVLQISGQLEIGAPEAAASAEPYGREQRAIGTNVAVAGAPRVLPVAHAIHIRSRLDPVTAMPQYGGEKDVGDPLVPRTSAHGIDEIVSAHAVGRDDQLSHRLRDFPSKGAVHRNAGFENGSAVKVLLILGVK